MALDESNVYKALTKSNNLMWGGDKFLMKVLLVISCLLMFGFRGMFGYVFGGMLLYFGRMGLVALAKWDSDALPIIMQYLTLKKYYLSRAIYPGVDTNYIFTFDIKKEKAVSGVPWFWRVYYFVFPATKKLPKKAKSQTKKEDK